MTYDSDISDKISLSRILDEFIINNDSPEIIIAFLKQHDESFQNIVKYSLYCNRLFQLDFFLCCGEYEQEYLLTKLKDTSVDDAAIVTWQILKSNSGNVQSLKYKFRKELHRILRDGPKHPYANRHEAYIMNFDNLCFKLSESNAINSIPLLVDENKLNQCFKHISYSLFQTRILQYDFYENLTNSSKFIFIDEIFKQCKIESIIRFALQLFDSDEDVKFKYVCLYMLTNTARSLDIIDQKTIDMVNQCSGFSELMLKMTIINSDVSQRIILFLLIYKHKWLYDWVQYNQEELDLQLNISELVLDLQQRNK